MNPNPSTPTHLPMLERAANQLLSVVAPSASRLVYTEVVLRSDKQTASTDGASMITLPHEFCGQAIPDNQAVSVGLLAHEIGHFFQPLQEVQQVEETANVPHWLSNIVLDIQGETMMANLFPALHEPLTAARLAVNREMLQEYQSMLDKGTTLAEIAPALALLGRFTVPTCSFDPQPIQRMLPSHLFDAGKRFLTLLWQAGDLAAEQVPNHLVQILTLLPELRSSTELRNPFGDPHGHVDGALGDLLRDELQRSVTGWNNTQANAILPKSFTLCPPLPEAERLAKTISTRFAVRRGTLEVMAPGRLERRELVSSPLPFRMAVKGNETPAPKVVICVDVSSSMECDGKQHNAFVAAQAVALAVQANGGEVVGLLFDQCAAVSLAEDATPLFAPPHERGIADGTCFHFLVEAWRRWSHHRILLITDGQGTVPTVLPSDRQRTSAIVIPDGSGNTLRSICERVVLLPEPRLLPSVLATLIPRTVIA